MECFLCCSTHSNPFYTITSTLTVQSDVDSRSSIEIAVLPNSMVSLLGYMENGNRKYCCTSYGIKVVHFNILLCRTITVQHLIT